MLNNATVETDNPDLRDRAYIYWRLLSTDPEVCNAWSSFSISVYDMPTVLGCFVPLSLSLSLMTFYMMGMLLQKLLLVSICNVMLVTPCRFTSVSKSTSRL